MKSDVLEPVISIAALIVGVAIIAVLVSQKSNTAGVLAAAGGAFANSLSAATAPVTGAATAPNVNAGAGGGAFNINMGSLALPNFG